MSAFTELLFWVGVICGSVIGGFAMAGFIGLIS